MLLKVEQVAEMLQVDIGTIYRWVRRGELRAFNVSLNFNSKKPRLRFKTEDVEAFLESRIPTQGHVKTRAKTTLSKSWIERMKAVGLPVK